ncbi:glycosyltransferase family 2 protein [Prevotella salivae]|jgi:glycosyl transferase cpsN(V)|uniref:glycosyltransferase family A protein n=1 Tax=Segatella salivae TaxID=228604 RepID=UPI001C5D6CEC|nr:glycosyltransferase family A protein [Segatella salivae]MBW4764108.1 glycosyltransferase family 2 protein [Segatella salivae]
MENKLVTIVTPTYNRADKLPWLYESLCNQTSKDFIWLCIDDGSTDNTQDLISTYIHEQKNSESPFSIQYLKKENGGKHSALNVAFRKVQTELLFIVDSDDVLIPDAINTISEDWKQTHNREKLCGIGYLRGYSADQRIGDAYTQNFVISNFITERYNKGVDGDKAEVWVTEKLRDFQYPEVKGERFISESVAWIWLAKQYDMLFVNKIIYITEYLVGGLSDSGRALRFKCPHLMAYGSLMTMSKEFSFKIRMKETLLYIVYSLFGKKSLGEIFDCPYKLLVCINLLPGYLLYRLWKHKYMG